MVNSAKTPTGKARKGQVTVRADSGSIKACFPRSYCNKGQIKLATGISLVDGWEAKASQLQRRLQMELEDGKLDDGEGNFDLGRYQEILKEYGLQARLRLVKSSEILTSDNQLPPKPELSLMEVWDMYCEYKHHKLAETTYQLRFRGDFQRLINSAIEATKSEDAIKIHNWLIENRALSTVKAALTHLSHAYRLAIKQNKLSYNPFDGLGDELEIKAKNRIISQKDDCEDSGIFDKDKSYSWDEALTIINYVKHTPRIKHWYPFIEFKFLTGCRTGEAMGLWWGDIFWHKEVIVIRRNYNSKIKIFKPTKNESERIFPMPRDGGLWNLLKSIPQGEPNECVFKSKNRQPVDLITFWKIWGGRPHRGDKGVIGSLIEQGEVSKYLPPYNTRHTFINHQINDIGIAPHIVNTWCDHGDNISKEHYRQLDSRITPGYGTPATTNQQVQQQSEIDLLKKQMKQQQELINKLLQDKDK